MKFAVAKRIMTPRRPVFLAGIGARMHKSEGVLDELYVKTVLLSANRDMLLVTFDALGADRGFVLGVKEALRIRFGLEGADVLLQFSHTHASLYLTGEHPELRRGNYSMGQDDWPDDPSTIDYSEDVAYYHQLKELVLELVECCYEDLQPGRLNISSGRSRAAINRRLVTENGVQWAPAPEAEMDDELAVLTLTDGRERVKVVLFSTGCHPTALGADNYLMSAEFVGHACVKLEEACPGSIAVFLQGCAADLRPRHSLDGDRFKPCSPEEMRAAGDELAEEVARVLREGTFAALEGPFCSKLISLELHSDTPDEERIARLLAGEAGEVIRRAFERSIKAERQRAVWTKLPLYVQTWRLSERTVLVALESEIPTGYSLRLKHEHPDKTLVLLGYSNGVYTYIPTRRILEEGGYEADHPFAIGFRSRFVAETEDRIVQEVNRQIESSSGRSQ